MSDINTSPINENYPIPGITNNSSGFRENYIAIKTALDTTKAEITDIQNKSLVKLAITGISVIDNDLNNTQLSRASISKFRKRIYDLGESLSGNVLIDASKGDILYGTAISDISIGFVNWDEIASSGNYREVKILLKIQHENTKVYFPDSYYVTSNPTWVQSGMRTSIYKLNNFNNLSSIFPNGDPYCPIEDINIFDPVYQSSSDPVTSARIHHYLTAPYDNYELALVFSSYDGGETFDVDSVSYSDTMNFHNINYIKKNSSPYVPVPLDLSSNATIDGSVILIRNNELPFDAIGNVGDKVGNFYANNDFIYVATANYDGVSPIWKKIGLRTFITPMPTITVDITPSTLPIGGEYTLTWSSTNAYEISMKKNNVDVEISGYSGSTTVTPTVADIGTETYEITVVNSRGPVSQSASVIILDALLPTVTASASPSSVVAGDQTTLTWSSTNAVSVELKVGGIPVTISGTSGTYTLNTTTAKTYTAVFTATNVTGVTAVSSVSVVASHPLPTITASASNSTVSAGNPVTFTWASTNAVTVNLTIDGNSVFISGESGTYTLNTTASKTYTAVFTAISVTGATAVSSVSVIADASIPTITAATPSNTVIAGDPVTFTWLSTNAVSVALVIDGVPILSSGSTGTYTLVTTTAKTYTAVFTATSITGATAVSSVSVVAQPQAPTLSVSISPTQVIPLEKFTLYYTSTNASYVVFRRTNLSAPSGWTEWAVLTQLSDAIEYPGGWSLPVGTDFRVITYELEAINSDGVKATGSVNLTVRRADPAIIDYFTVNGNSSVNVSLGDSYTLSWMVSNYYDMKLSVTDPSGSTFSTGYNYSPVTRVETPTVQGTYTYTLKAYNAQYDLTSSTVTVVVGPAATPTLTVYRYIGGVTTAPAPGTVNTPSSVIPSLDNLTFINYVWSSYSATSVKVYDPSTALPVTISGGGFVNQVYSSMASAAIADRGVPIDVVFTATSAGGVNTSVTFTHIVNPSTPVALPLSINSFYVSPNPLDFNTNAREVTASWNVSGAARVDLSWSGTFGSGTSNFRPHVGSENIPVGVIGPGTFTLTATDSNGVSTSQVVNFDSFYS